MRKLDKGFFCSVIWTFIVFQSNSNVSHVKINYSWVKFNFVIETRVSFLMKCGCSFIEKINWNIKTICVVNKCLDLLREYNERKPEQWLFQWINASVIVVGGFTSSPHYIFAKSLTSLSQFQKTTPHFEEKNIPTPKLTQLTLNFN